MKKITKFIDKNFKILFIILIILTIILFSIGFILAKYSDEITKTGTLLVAKYSLNQSETINLGMLSPGETLIYDFEVSNIEDGKVSEVAQTYNIKITTTDNLPLTYTLYGTNTSNTGSLASDLDEETLTTLIPGRFPHTKEAKHSYTLEISWPRERTESIYLNEVDQVSLSIEATQEK